MQCREVVCGIFMMVFGMTPPGHEPTTYRIRGGCAHHQAIYAVRYSEFLRCILRISIQFLQICLNIGGKSDALTAFDELYDMPEQAVLREDCHALVGKFFNV